MEQIQTELAGIAERLAAEVGALPMPVAFLSERFGIRVTYVDTGERFSSYCRIEDCGRRAEILIGDTSRGSNFERFCIAHEVAHLLIWREFKLSPATKSEYWRHEQLCDDFARRLLMPKAALKRHIERSKRGAVAHLDLVYAIERDCGVHWFQAARRLGDFVEGVHFLKLSPHKTNMLKVVASSFPNQKEMGLLLDTRKDALARYLATTIVRAGKSARPEPLDVGVLKRARVESAKCARAAGLSVMYREARLCISFNEEDMIVPASDTRDLL